MTSQQGDARSIYPTNRNTSIIFIFGLKSWLTKQLQACSVRYRDTAVKLYSSCDQYKYWSCWREFVDKSCQRHAYVHVFVVQNLLIIIVRNGGLNRTVKFSQHLGTDQMDGSDSTWLRNSCWLLYRAQSKKSICLGLYILSFEIVHSDASVDPK